MSQKKNQGRQRKDFDGEPLGAFLTKHFGEFAWTWPKRKDLDLLSIECAPNEWPIVGNPELLRAFFLAAALPEEIKDDGVHARLLLHCLKECPDFTLGVLTYLRKQLAKLKPHIRKILLENEAGKLSDAEKQARSEIRKLVAGTKTKHKEAWKFVQERWRKNAGERGRNMMFRVGKVIGPA